MRTGESAIRAGSGCAVIASTSARFRHDEETGLRDGNRSLKDDLYRHFMHIGAHEHQTPGFAAPGAPYSPANR